MADGSPPTIATRAPTASLLAADEAARLVLTPEHEPAVPVDWSSAVGRQSADGDENEDAQRAAPQLDEVEQLASAIGLRSADDLAGDTEHHDDAPLFVSANDGSIKRRTAVPELPVPEAQVVS